MAILVTDMAALDAASKFAILLANLALKVATYTIFDLLILILHLLFEIAQLLTQISNGLEILILHLE